MRLLLLTALFAVATPATYAYYFACHRCRKAPSHAACNRQGIEFCRLDQGACVTRVKVRRGGRVEISKGCRKLKQCGFRCRGRGKYNKCSYCCFSEMCNVGDWPPPAAPCGCRPCQNGGVCQQTAIGFRCRCPPSYTGRYCERRVTVPENPCDRNPCRNGATCENLICPGQYVCVCRPGYKGKNCETHVDPCRTSPCVNGGTCVSRGASYTCRCRPGFSGVRCEKETNPCANNPCKNGGTCTSHCTGYTCLCRPGFVGRHCETGTQCFRCPSESGLFPDTYDCTKFYHCSHWTAYHKDCPANLHFNPRLKVCDWPFSAGCQQQRPNQGQEMALRSSYCTEADSCAVEEEDEDEEEDKRDDIPGYKLNTLVEELRSLLEDKLAKEKREDTQDQSENIEGQQPSDQEKKVDESVEEVENTEDKDDQPVEQEESTEGDGNKSVNQEEDTGSNQEEETEVKTEEASKQDEDAKVKNGLTPAEEKDELEEMEHEIRELQERLDNLPA